MIRIPPIGLPSINVATASSPASIGSAFQQSMISASLGLPTDGGPPSAAQYALWTEAALPTVRAMLAAPPAA